jgi:hypothetical protein
MVWFRAWSLNKFSIRQIFGRYVSNGDKFFWLWPFSVVARSKLWVCTRSLADNSWFESRRRRGLLSLVSVVCCQVEVCATDRSLVQRSPTEWGLSQCDREASIKWGPSPIGDFRAWKNNLAASWVAGRPYFLSYLAPQFQFHFTRAQLIS